MRKILAAILTLSLAACMGPPVVTASSTACSSLIPPEWALGVAGAPLPDGNTVADWEVFADAQTGKLDQANGRTRDTVGIISRCEARDAAAMRKAAHRFLGIF